MLAFYTLVFAYAALRIPAPCCCGFSVICMKGCWGLICLYFVFRMQENANELQYPEASEAQDETVELVLCTHKFAQCDLTVAKHLRTKVIF